MTAATILSDRYAGIYTCQLQSANIDGDQAVMVELPTGVGDSLLLAWNVSVTQIATIVAAGTTALGPFVTIAQTAPLIAIEPAMRHNTFWVISGAATELRASQQLDHPVLWRTTESVRIVFQEVDTNVAPTADLSIVLTCRRMRAF